MKAPGLQVVICLLYTSPGFTIELGRGVNPLPLDSFEAVYAKAQEMLLLAALM